MRRQPQQQFYIIVMSEELIEYLDYARPRRPKSHRILQIIPEVQAIANRFRETPKQQQKNQQKMPSSRKLTLMIELQDLKIVIKEAPFQEQQADAIIIPYTSAEMDLYPSSLFRHELAVDIEKINKIQSKNGELYLRSKKIFNYKFRAFIKVGIQSAVNDLVYGLSSLSSLIDENKIAINTISIALDRNFDLKELIESLLRLKLGSVQRVLLLVRSRQELNQAWKAVL